MLQSARTNTWLNLSELILLYIYNNVSFLYSINYIFSQYLELRFQSRISSCWVSEWVMLFNAKWTLIRLYEEDGSLTKYTHFFLFIFWWHQLFSFPFYFSLLVFPTLQWPKLCIFSLYIIYVTTFYINNIFHFPKKNNFMLVTPRTER
jgi:hypothetical protein